jgi:hypothetical protein
MESLNISMKWGCAMKINFVNVYGLDESVVASGYSMKTDFGLKESTPTEKDLKRASKLALSLIGSGHDQFLTGIIVQFDISTTNKMWTELQRYHFVDFVSASSTIHKLADFNLAESYSKYVDTRIVVIMQELQREYKENPSRERQLRLLNSNPAGFELTARLTTNYRQLKTIYKQRRDHILPEWREFCQWVETLPNSELIIGERK